jgi:hypothetical protein
MGISPLLQEKTFMTKVKKYNGEWPSFHAVVR